MKKLRKGGFKKNENNGQLSLEFILISLVAILILISITLPLTSIAVDSTIDSSNAIETKSELIKVVNCIDDIYSDGIGSKRIVFIEVPQDMTIHFYKNFSSNNGIASVNINLNNGTNKIITVPFKANNVESTIFLRKRVNTKVTVEWVEDMIFVKN